MTGRICIIIGTRPEAIKMSPVVRACEGSGAEWFMGHTGQERLCDVDMGVLGGLGLPDAGIISMLGQGQEGRGSRPGRCFWVLKRS